MNCGIASSTEVPSESYRLLGRLRTSGWNRTLVAMDDLSQGRGGTLVQRFKLMLAAFQRRSIASKAHTSEEKLKRLLRLNT